VGIWQFIRGTGRRYGLNIDYWVDERSCVVRSTEAACQYLGHLYGMFQDWNLAMAAYNSGEFRVMSAVRRAESRNYWDLKLPRQTQDYVPEMMAAAWIGSHLEDYGFDFKPSPPLEFEELKVDKAVDLSLIAKHGDFPRDALITLNPHLLRWCTPPDRPGYVIYVPPGKADSITVALSKLSGEESVSFAKHRVKRGETLFEIARGYGTNVEAIMKRNGIRNARQLRAGSSLVIPSHPDRPYQEPVPNGVVAAAEKVLPPVDVPSGQSKRFYTVRRGDTLSLIAQRLGVSVKKLQQWNNMGRSTRIYSNQVLQYLHTQGAGKPGRSVAAAKEDSTQRRVHIVQAGESLSSISRSYGTSVKALLHWNGHLRQNSVLHPGDKLVLFIGS
jgi:membrane-bound lytic murein transglycosylase D